MRTTLNIDEQLLRDVMRLTGENGKSNAVTKALEEYRRIMLLERLMDRRGVLDLDLDDWHEFRHMGR